MRKIAKAASGLDAGWAGFNILTSTRSSDKALAISRASYTGSGRFKPTIYKATLEKSGCRLNRDHDVEHLFIKSLNTFVLFKKKKKKIPLHDMSVLITALL